MGRCSSPYVIGDCWLDKRRDRKSPDIWQIAFIKPATNSITYKSTRMREFEGAKKCLESFVVGYEQQQIHPVRTSVDKLAVPVLPHLLSYWKEHGQSAVSAATIEHHLRCFVAFLQQDPVGVTCEFKHVDKNLVERYYRWAMSPNSWTVHWNGKLYRSKSGGVCGATVKRSLASVKAALNFALENRVVPYLLRLPPMPNHLKSAPRNRVLTMEEIGAMLAYAEGDTPLLNWLHIMLATGVRPIVATKLVPAKQWNAQTLRLNLHPDGQRYTNKRNPRVPIIPQLEEKISSYVGPWILQGVCHDVLSRRWRLMREALGFSQEVVPKTLRHTIATELAEARISDRYIAMLLGHVEIVRWRDRSEISPAYYQAIIPTLSSLWDKAHEHASLWSKQYVVIKSKRGGRVVVERVKYPGADYKTVCRSILDIVSPARMLKDRALPHFLTGHGC